MHSHHRAMLDSRPQTENGEYLKSIANGTNGNRLEAYPTLRRRLVMLGPWVMVIPHDLGPSLAAPKSNVA